MIKTIKDLKDLIRDLPDDMAVRGTNTNGDLTSVCSLVLSEDKLTEEEIRDGYPNGVTPTLILFTD